MVIESAVSLLPLDEHRIDLWCVRLDDNVDPDLLKTCRGMLAPDEIDRADRFHFERDRARSLVARALVRTALTRYLGGDPRRWRFARNAYGKPHLIEPPPRPIEFNVSHSVGMVVCAVSLGHEVGVDVECLDRTVDGLALARRFFAPWETALLERLPPEERVGAFFAIWTLKEAYVKARGLGLSVPLGQFGFSFSDDRPPQIRFRHGMEDDPAAWQFAQLRMADRYRAAVAARDRAGDRRLAMEVRWTTPGRRGDHVVSLPPNEANRWVL